MDWMDGTVTKIASDPKNGLKDGMIVEDGTIRGYPHNLVGVEVGQKLRFLASDDGEGLFVLVALPR